jgi:all-trans-retinol 13,14-reductase
MTEGKDILMIGGGLGGLVTGALLAKEGYRVRVVEKNRTIGGGLQCFSRRGVMFETGMHILGGFMPGHNLNKICSYLGILDRLNIRHTDADCIDSITFGGADGETYRLPRGREAFEGYLANLFPSEAEALHSYFDALWALSEEVDLFYLRHDENSMMRQHSDEFLMPADEFIAKYITDGRLREVLAYMNPMYAGVAGHTPAFVHALINVLYINGSSMFVGGSQQMADALAEVIVAAGGEIHAGDGVCRVDVDCDSRRVNYVETESGERYTADLYISSIHPCALLPMLPERAFMKSYRKRLGEIPNSYSSFSLYIKFREGSTQPFVNHPCYYQEEHGHVWTLADYDEERFPLGFMCLTPTSVGQGEYAERMTVNCPMPFSVVERWSESTLGHRPDDYREWKERTKQRVLGKLERLYPGICSRIEFCFASSPLTVRDYYATKEGALYGYNRDCQNMMISQIPVGTKVRNLLLTGQNINLHGICGVPLTAIETAEAIVGHGAIVKKINEQYGKQ